MENATPNDSPLLHLLKDTAREHGLSVGDLTVLDRGTDPFKIGDAGHQNGQWFAEKVQTHGFADRTVHLRGLHYAIATGPVQPIFKPDGTRYLNDETNWDWLQKASKAARWLGYIPWEQIVDQRNAAPTVRIYEPVDPVPYLSVGLEVHIPDADGLDPKVGVPFIGAQPYKLVLIGEKSSLDEVLAPIAERYEADLYLPTGDISDTLVHQMAKIGAEDGRPMVVLYFADCDPSGWNMPIVVGRKLQAFTASLYPELSFRQYRVALTPDQVREFDLPSAPLKTTEPRADKWRDAMGTEQTEIDALVVFRPDLLRQLALDAIAPFFDAALDRRVRRVKQEWIERAQEVVDSSINQDHLEQLRNEAQRKLNEMREEIERLNESMHFSIDDFDLPEVPPVPEPVINDDQPTPLIDSEWSFVDQCQALKASKEYREEG